MLHKEVSIANTIMNIDSNNQSITTDLLANTNKRLKMNLSRGGSSMRENSKQSRGGSGSNLLKTLSEN